LATLRSVKEVRSVVSRIAKVLRFSLAETVMATARKDPPQNQLCGSAYDSDGEQLSFSVAP